MQRSQGPSTSSGHLTTDLEGGRETIPGSQNNSGLALLDAAQSEDRASLQSDGDGEGCGMEALPYLTT